LNKGDAIAKDSEIKLDPASSYYISDDCSRQPGILHPDISILYFRIGHLLPSKVIGNLFKVFDAMSTIRTQRGDHVVKGVYIFCLGLEVR